MFFLSRAGSWLKAIGVGALPCLKTIFCTAWKLKLLGKNTDIFINFLEILYENFIHKWLDN